MGGSAVAGRVGCDGGGAVGPLEARAATPRGLDTRIDIWSDGRRGWGGGRNVEMG